eukprot:2285649-Rhodomonas_salina.1
MLPHDADQTQGRDMRSEQPTPSEHEHADAYDSQHNTASTCVGYAPPHPKGQEHARLDTAQHQTQVRSV